MKFPKGQIDEISSPTTLAKEIVEPSQIYESKEIF